MGLLTQEDSTLFRQFFKEMCYLRGLPIEYIYPVDEETTIHGQILPEFSSIVDLNIIFDTNPKIKTLKNYGWVSEDSNDKPYIAYFPYDTPYIQTKARMRLKPIGSEKPGKWFEITDITHAIEYPDAYICKLAPVFETQKERLDYSETNSNYINQNNQPDEPTNHHKEINKSLEKHLENELKDRIKENKNFKYLNI